MDASNKIQSMLKCSDFGRNFFKALRVTLVFKNPNQFITLSSDIENYMVIPGLYLMPFLAAEWRTYCTAMEEQNGEHCDYVIAFENRIQDYIPQLSLMPNFSFSSYKNEVNDKRHSQQMTIQSTAMVIVSKHLLIFKN